MACMNPVMIHWNEVEEKYQFTYTKECDPMKSIHVACGRCPACAQTWRTQLAQRAWFEFNRYGYNKTCFLTLTVAPEFEKECFGDDMSLNHRPIQLFMKRLRAKLKYYGINVKVKYLVAGEYGERTHRPHWHMILYGFKPSDLRVFGGRSKKGFLIYKSEFIESCWQYGIVDIGDVTEHSAPYLVKYIAKFKEIRQDEFTTEDGVIIKKPYIVYPKEMLGSKYFMEHAKQFLRIGYLPCSNGSKVPIPKSYIKLIERTDDEVLQEELFNYKERLQEYYREVNEELRELGYYTPSDRYAFAVEQGKRHRENYNSYMLTVKGVML